MLLSNIVRSCSCNIDREKSDVKEEPLIWIEYLGGAKYKFQIAFPL